MYTFSKSERLCSKLLIDKLFKEGLSFYLAPFKVMWLETPIPCCKSNAQILIGVSKKLIKKSVYRNKIKRQIKEAYRLNKLILYDTLNTNNRQCVFAILYTSKQINDYNYIQDKILLILQRLQKELSVTLSC